MAKQKPSATKAANLGDLRLVRLTDSVTKLAIVDSVPSEYSIKFQIESMFLKEKSILIYKSFIEVTSQGSDQSSVLISARFNTVYDTKRKQILPSEQTDFITSAFADTWPFIRDFVHAISFRMGIQPLLIPTPDVDSIVAKARAKARPKEIASSQTKGKSSKGKRG